VTNPNAVWSYNSGSTALPGPYANYWGIDTFWAAGNDYPPGWTQADNTPVFVTDANDWVSGDVIVHATTGTAPLANLTWTSPGSGIIDISGYVWDGGKSWKGNPEILDTHYPKILENPGHPLSINLIQSK
jgi:hypothetical protein